MRRIFKKNSFLFFVFIAIAVNAQENYSVVVEYQIKLQTYSQKAFLVGGSSASIFFFSRDSSDKLDNIFDNSKIPINPYFTFIFDNTQNLMYQTISYDTSKKINDSIRLSKDKFPEMNWDLKNESKEILGYKCRKATTSFRGRKYEVWYAIDLPGNYFPWKFKGLPGMILGFSDDERAFTGEAKMITLNRKIPDFFTNRISKFYKKYKNSAISYQENIAKENESLEDSRRKFLSSLPLGTETIPTPLREAKIERAFEWDEPKKP